MDLYALFRAASELSPIAIIGLLVGLLYLLLFKHPTAKSIGEDIRNMRKNDLHHLEEIVETIRRIEVSQEKNFALILERLKS